jgi:hypothetical protein
MVKRGTLQVPGSTQDERKELEKSAAACLDENEYLS